MSCRVPCWCRQDEQPSLKEAHFPSLSLAYSLVCHNLGVISISCPALCGTGGFGAWEQMLGSTLREPVCGLGAVGCASDVVWSIPSREHVEQGVCVGRTLLQSINCICCW